MAISMRPATAEDGAWLASLPASVARNADGRPGDVRIVSNGATAVGAVRLRHEGDGVLRIECVHVAEEHRGVGVGTVILTSLDEEAARAGDALAIRVRRDARAVSLLTRLGFRPTGVERGPDHLEMRLG